MVHSTICDRALLECQGRLGINAGRVTHLASCQEGVECGHQVREEVTTLNNFGCNRRCSQHLKGKVDDGVIGLAISNEVELSQGSVYTSKSETQESFKLRYGNHCADKDIPDADAQLFPHAQIVQYEVIQP